MNNINVTSGAYNPSIQSLLDECESDWGVPEINAENLVPFGIEYIDQAVYGIDITNGELDIIMGAEKQRKTTLAANILANIMTGIQPKVKPIIAVDTLESGMQPKRYRDALISIMATRKLFYSGHKPNEFCPACGLSVCRELGITPEFLKYNARTIKQAQAIEYAMDTMYSWPLLIHGANPQQGNTRSLEVSVKHKESRWLEMVKESGVKIFVVDHVQQYAFADEPTDYEKQLRAVAAISDVVAMYGIVVLMLSQVSLTSLREARTGAGKLNAAGGTKAQQEANLVLSVGYQQNSGMMRINIEESRKSGTLSVWQRMDDASGAFYGKATIKPAGGTVEI